MEMGVLLTSRRRGADPKRGQETGSSYRPAPAFPSAPHSPVGGRNWWPEAGGAGGLGRGGTEGVGTQGTGPQGGGRPGGQAVGCWGQDRRGPGGKGWTL